MSLPQPPVLLAPQREWNREPVDSVLQPRFTCRDGGEKASEPSEHEKRDHAGHRVQPIGPAHDNFGANHASRPQTLSAKALLRPVLR